MPLFVKKISSTAEDMCPLLGIPCIKTRCHMWTHIMGKHPQTGADLDMYDCSIKWVPTLLIETANQSRQTGAAIESFRNEMVLQGEHAIQIQRGDPQQQIGIAPNVNGTRDD